MLNCTTKIVITISLLVLIATPSYAEDDIELSGRLMSMVSVIDNNRALDGVESVFANSLRLIFDAGIDDSIDFEMHFVQDVTILSNDTFFGTAGLGGGTGESRYRAFDFTWKDFDRHVVTANLSIDRLNFKFSLPNADITIGRQPITFGKAYFWNPLDIFMPFSAQEYERDYKGGVDAIRIDIPFGNFSGMNIVGALGREIIYDGSYKDGNQNFDATWYASSLLARYFTTINGWDYAIQCGKVYGGYQLGGGLVGEIDDYQVRAEAAYLKAKDSPPILALDNPFIPALLKGDLIKDNLVVVLGFGRYFQSTLDIEVEYLFNGAGDPKNPETSVLRMLNGGNMHIGRHLLGALASYQFDPLTTGQVACIYSFSDSSFQLQPLITCSIDDNIDMQFGMVFNFGEPPDLGEISPGIHSEFGTMPNFYFMEYKGYF